MLDASGHKTRQKSPATCPSLIYPVHSFAPFILVYFIQQCGQQVRSLSTPGEKQIPEEECNKALSLCPPLSLSECVCVCAVEGRWAVLQSLPNKLVFPTQKKSRQCSSISVQTLDPSLKSYFTTGKIRSTNWPLCTVEKVRFVKWCYRTREK